MEWYEIVLWGAGIMVATAPIVIWYRGLTGLRFGFAGLGILASAVIWYALIDGFIGFLMLMRWVGAFTYIGVSALIAHTFGRLNVRGSTQ